MKNVKNRLVRMRSAVQIHPADPETPCNRYGYRGFFIFSGSSLNSALATDLVTDKLISGGFKQIFQCFGGGVSAVLERNG